MQCVALTGQDHRSCLRAAQTQPYLMVAVSLLHTAWLFCTCSIFLPWNLGNCDSYLAKLPKSTGGAFGKHRTADMWRFFRKLNQNYISTLLKQYVLVARGPPKWTAADVILTLTSTWSPEGFQPLGSSSTFTRKVKNRFHPECSKWTCARRLGADMVRETVSYSQRCLIISSGYVY